MSRKIEALRTFKTRFKRLSKKFKTLTSELNELGKEILDNPEQGKPLGAGFYKIRLASKSKGGGKSGGFRIVTYYIEQKGDSETVYLVTIYDKSEESSIDKKELLKILKKELI
jgi:hypothetical protein